MIEQSQYRQLLQQLKHVVPDDRIYTDELRTLGWGTDASFYHMVPKMVIRSDNEQEVSQIMCHSRFEPPAPRCQARA